MEKGVTYDYDPSTKTLKKSTRPSSKGLTSRQKDQKQRNVKGDKTGRNPFWPIHT